jgi:hypothetical protein
MKQHKPLLKPEEWDQVNAYINMKDVANRKKLARARAKAKKPGKGHLMWHVPAGARVCGPWSIPSWNY